MRKKRILKCEDNLLSNQSKQPAYPLPCFQEAQQIPNRADSSCDQLGNSTLKPSPYTQKTAGALKENHAQRFSETQYPFLRQDINGQFCNSMFNLFTKYRFFSCLKHFLQVTFIPFLFFFYTQFQKTQKYEKGAVE